MSFFDEAQEPRRATRTAHRRRRPSGGARRPPGGRRVIQIRRAIAAVVIFGILILIVLGVHSCQISARNSSLKSYNNDVASLNRDSDQTGRQLFGALSSAGGSGNQASLQTQVESVGASAETQLNRARHFDVPDEVKGAQQNLLLAIQMRRDGIANIARQIPPALGPSTSNDAISSIAAEMARFYASDVMYKDYTLPLIVKGLHSAGIAVGGPSGQMLDPGQFLTDIQWLTPSYIASQLHVSGQSGGKPAPGSHGHTLDSVTVGGTTLQTGSTNTIPATPPPTFTFNFTNSGNNTENNVTLKVSVSGTSISGQTIVPQTTAGEHATGQVTLSSSPSPGTYTVTATVEPVPGETNTANNTLSFPVTFQ